MQSPRPHSQRNHLVSMVTTTKPKGGQLLIYVLQSQLHTKQQVADHGRRALTAGRCWQPVASGQQVEQPAPETVGSAAARQMSAVSCRQNSLRRLSSLELRTARRRLSCIQARRLGIQTTQQHQNRAPHPQAMPLLR
jgi:hypothetical protein